MGVLTVTQLNTYISNQIKNDFVLSNIAVTGELTNVNYHYSGYVFFSIKDENSTIRCFMPEGVKKYLKVTLKDGLKVVITGYVNVFVKGGYYSIFVKSCEVLGDGELDRQFKLMYERLEKEGLFDKNHKKAIPKFPKTIGVVTSSTGAAVEDIKRIITNKNDVVDIIIFPVQVQGEGAGKDISKMIDFINKEYSYIDTLIVGRGGGSKEDLWAFNEEEVCYSIYNSNIPIISAVGHEVDFSLSDYVADLRAETPTAAAEICCPNTSELREYIEELKNSLLIDLKSKLTYDELFIDKLISDIKKSIEDKITLYEHKLQLAKQSLVDNNPKKILDKGFNILRDDKDKIISSVNDIKEDRYSLTFKDGRVSFIINDLRKEK